MMALAVMVMLTEVQETQRAMATDGYLVRKNIPIDMIAAQGPPDWQFLIFPITAPVTVA